MQFSLSIIYALQSLLQLAESDPDEFISRVRLAAIGGMPERFLLEVLQNLVKAGILRSTRGSHGGFALARPVDNITLLEVVEAVEGPMQSGLPGGNSLPDTARDWLQAHLEHILETKRSQLASMSVRQLMIVAARGRGQEAETR